MHLTPGVKPMLNPYLTSNVKLGFNINRSFFYSFNSVFCLGIIGAFGTDFQFQFCEQGRGAGRPSPLDGFAQAAHPSSPRPSGRERNCSFIQKKGPLQADASFYLNSPAALADGRLKGPRALARITPPALGKKTMLSLPIMQTSMCLRTQDAGFL